MTPSSQTPRDSETPDLAARCRAELVADLRVDLNCLKGPHPEGIRRTLAEAKAAGFDWQAMYEYEAGNARRAPASEDVSPA